MSVENDLIGILGMKRSNKDIPDRISACDDVSAVFLDSYSGGAAPEGAWSKLTLLFVDAAGIGSVTPKRARHLPTPLRHRAKCLFHGD